MIVSDSTVWIDYFNDTRTAAVETLRKNLTDNVDVLLFPIIILEVLSGFKKDEDFENARQAFMDFPVLALSQKTHVSAADLYRRLRKKGVTIRKPVDCLIAQGCMESGAKLLTTDRDFQHIARHSPLKLVH